MRSELVSFTAHYFRGSDKDYRLIISSCRAFIITAVAQLCVLGTTWIFGCFQFGNSPSAMSYVFTILNSLQGVLLFVMHCLLYKPVCTWFVFNYLWIYLNCLDPNQCVYICVHLYYLASIQMQGGGKFSLWNCLEKHHAHTKRNGIPFTVAVWIINASYAPFR